MLVLLRGTYVQSLLKENRFKPRKGYDAGDHPPMYSLSIFQMFHTLLQKNCNKHRLKFLYFFVDIVSLSDRTPMKVVTKEQLPEDEWRLYEYITRHFIASLSDDCTYKEIVIIFDIGGETFFLTGISCISHLIHSHFLFSSIF
jgi:hypothetical protein